MDKKPEGRKYITYSMPVSKFNEFTAYCKKRGISKYRFFQKIIEEALAKEVKNG